VVIRSALCSSAGVTCHYSVTLWHDVPLPKHMIRSQHVTISTHVGLRAQCTLHSGFWAMAMADWLSMHRMVGPSIFCFNSISNRRSQTTSLAACVAAMYLASVLERATALCFFDPQLIAPPASMKMKPDVDLRSFTLLAQSASTKPFKTIPLEMPHWKTSFQSLVARR
jgi:hypothetical protein